MLMIGKRVRLPHETNLLNCYVFFAGFVSAGHGEPTAPLFKEVTILSFEKRQFCYNGMVFTNLSVAQERARYFEMTIKENLGEDVVLEIVHIPTLEKEFDELEKKKWLEQAIQNLAMP